MNDLLTAISNWKPNRWLMFIGGLLMVLSIGSGVAGFEIKDEMRLSAFWGGLLVLMTGAAFAWKAAVLEALKEKRERE